MHVSSWAAISVGSWADILMGEASQGEGPPSKHLDINELSVLDYPSSRGVAEYANTAAGQATGIFPTYMQVGWLFAHM